MWRIFTNQQETPAMGVSLQTEGKSNKPSVCFNCLPFQASSLINMWLRVQPNENISCTKHGGSPQCHIFRKKNNSANGCYSHIASYSKFKLLLQFSICQTIERLELSMQQDFSVNGTHSNRIHKAISSLVKNNKYKSRHFLIHPI